MVLPERRKRLPAGCPRILIMGDREQSIEFDWLPFVNGRHVRPRFFCPACARGSQDIAEYPSRLNGRLASWAVLLPGARNSQRLSLDRITAALAAARAG